MGAAGVPVARELSKAPSERMTGLNVRRARPQVGKAARRAAGVTALVGCLPAAGNYNSGPSGRGCPRGDFLVGFLLRAPVDFDRTFEVRAVFDHDLFRRQIPNHRTV